MVQVTVATWIPSCYGCGQGGGYSSDSTLSLGVALKNTHKEKKINTAMCFKHALIQGEKSHFYLKIQSLERAYNGVYNPVEGDKEKIKGQILTNEKDSRYNTEFQNTI